MAELVVRGGGVVPGGAAEAFVGDVVVEDGRIAAAGSSGLGRVSAETTVDAAGCMVIPGLVQAHVHLCQTLFRGLADDMDVIEWLRRRIWPLEQAHDRRSLGASPIATTTSTLWWSTVAWLWPAATCSPATKPPSDPKPKRSKPPSPPAPPFPSAPVVTPSGPVGCAGADAGRSRSDVA